MGNRELTMRDAFSNALGTGQLAVLGLLGSPLKPYVAEIEKQIDYIEQMSRTSDLMKLIYQTIVTYKSIQSASDAGIQMIDAASATMKDATLTATKACEMMLQMLNQHNPGGEGRERAIVRFNRELRVWDPARVLKV